ncbi:MAG: hypothetical protein QNJ44_11870, partial [Rhodobacter sp.]|nr:hypothetical protein [Rhodobacter sp.]
SQDFATHYAWLPTNRYGIECLAGLDQVPAAGATLVVGAPKVARGTGVAPAAGTWSSPARHSIP